MNYHITMTYMSMEYITTLQRKKEGIYVHGIFHYSNGTCSYVHRTLTKTTENKKRIPYSMNYKSMKPNHNK